MTDKARELLERAMESLDGGFLYRLELKEKILSFLAEPEVKREALSVEEILKGWSVASLYGHVDRATFISGVRFAEKRHGIGGGDE